MRLNLCYILDSIDSSWKKHRGGPSFVQETIFNSFCKVISSGNYTAGKSSISRWLSGKTQRIDETLQKFAYNARDKRKTLAIEIEKTIIPNIQTDKISTLVSDWKEIIDQDNTIPANEKRTFDALADSSVSQFLAEIILYSFIHDCCSEVSANKRSEIKHSGRKRGDEEEQASQRNNLLSSLRKKSCEKLSQQKRLLKYEIIPQLVSKPDIDLSEHDYNLLVAEGGAGKTSFLLDHWARLLESNETETKELPVYVPLNRFEGNDEFFIRNYIKKHYFSSQNDLGFDDWINNAKGCDIILLLDAINEAKNSRELGSEIEELCALGCKVILTSRHEMEGWVSLENFKRVHLLPLSETIVDEQLKEHKLEVSERLRPFLIKPMYLALLLRVGEGAKEVESPGELLLAHHRWVQQTFGVDKHGVVYNEIGEKAFETVLPQMATVTDTLKFNGKDVKAVIEEHFADEGWDYREVLNLFVDAGILTKERQTYFFSHEHYFDFYRAYSIHLEMQEDNVPQLLCSQIITSIIAEFLGDLCGEYRFENEEGSSYIENWLQKHASNRRDDETRLVCRNLVETIKISRNGYLEGCCFENLDLSYCNFYHTSVPFTSFRNSFITKDAFISPGHSDFITGIVATPDDKYIITGSDDCSIKMWDSQTGRFVREEYVGHSSCLSISSGGEFLISGSASGSLDIYNLSTKECEVVRDEQAGSTCSIAITPNAKFIISAHSNGVVLLWERISENWQVRKRLTENKHCYWRQTVVALSNNVFAVNIHGNVCLWDIALSSVIKELENEKACLHMAANTHTNCLYYIDGEGCLKEYNINTSRLRTIAQTSLGEIKWMSCSSKEQLLAVGIGESIYVWETVSCKLYRTLNSHAEVSQEHGVFCCPSRLAVTDLRNTIRIVDISSKVYINQIIGHGTPPWEEKQHELISPNGQIAIRYNHHGQLIVWNMGEETLFSTNLNGFIRFDKASVFHTKYPFTVDSPFSPDSTKLAFSQRVARNEQFSELAFNREPSYDHEFNVLDLVTCQRLVPNLGGERVNNCMWISDNKIVCVTQQNSIFILKCFVDATGVDQCDTVFTASLGENFDCAEAYILPCGSGIIFCSKTNELSIYDLAKKALLPLKQYSSDDILRIRISPQGECAIISNEAGIDILNKSQAGWILDRTPLVFGENNIRFWGSSIIIASESSGEYKTFSVWCRESGKLLYTIQSWTDPPVVSKNERFLLYGERNTNMLIVCDALTGKTIESVECYGYQDNWVLSNAGNVLASINHDGVIMIKDFQTKSTVFWDPIDARDVWGANFSESEGLDDFTKLTLSMYGANIS